MKTIKKILDSFKGMSRVDKYVTILSCIVLILLVINIIVNINYLSSHEEKINYEEQKILQIESKILEENEKLNKLEQIIKNLQGGNK